VIGIDLDYIDAAPAVAAWDATTAIMGATPLVRVGRAPKKLGFYRAPASGVLAGRNFGQFEIYAKSGQTLLHGIHEKTLRPYEWIAGAEPSDVTPADLPQVTLDQVSELVGALRRVSAMDPVRGTAPRRSPSRSGAADLGGASDRASGAVARVIAQLREAPDPLTIAGELIARAPEGDRHGAMLGVVTGLAQLGFSDCEIDGACRRRYTALFAGAGARAADFDRALSWARDRIGADAATIGADPLFASIEARWRRS